MSLKNIVKCFIEDKNKDRTSFMVLFHEMEQFKKDHGEKRLVATLNNINFSKIISDSKDY